MAIKEKVKILDKKEAKKAQGMAFEIFSDPSTVYGQGRFSTKPSFLSMLSGGKSLSSGGKLSKELLEYAANKDKEENDDIRVLGALDEADSRDAMPEENQGLVNKLRTKLYPVVQADLKHNASAPDRRAAYATVGSIGLAFAAGGADRMTNNENIVKTLRSVAKKENIPVGNIRVGKDGVLGMIMSGPHYNPMDKSILTTSSDAIGLHELGHAKDYAKAGKLKMALRAAPANIPHIGSLLRKVLPGQLSTIPILPLAAAAPLLSNTIREKMKGDDEDSIRSKAVSFVEDNPWTIGVGGMAPILRDEVVATDRKSVV